MQVNTPEKRIKNYEGPSTLRDSKFPFKLKGPLGPRLIINEMIPTEFFHISACFNLILKQIHDCILLQV